jgi:hypothetical protein
VAGGGGCGAGGACTALGAVGGFAPLFGACALNVEDIKPIATVRASIWNALRFMADLH